MRPSDRCLCLGAALGPRSNVRRLLPCKRLLDGPAVAVGVGEEAETPPREILNVRSLDAACPEERVDFVDVLDDKLGPLHRSRLRLDPSLADRDAADGAGRRETYEATVIPRAHVHVSVKAESFDVERLRALNVSDGDSDQFETENHAHLLDDRLTHSVARCRPFARTAAPPRGDRARLLASPGSAS